MSSVYLIVTASLTLANQALAFVLSNKEEDWVSVKRSPVPDIRDDAVWKKYNKEGDKDRRIVGISYHTVKMKPGDDVLIRIGNEGSDGWIILADEPA